MRNKIILFVIAVLVLVLAGCSQAGYKNLGAEEAQKLIDSNTNLDVVDVREQFEYEQGHIPGATLIPVGELENRLSELDKDQPVLLVCLSGARSAVGADLLVKNGFKEVYNLAGGMQSWQGKVE